MIAEAMIAEAMAAVPVVIVPMRKMVIVPVLEPITPVVPAAEPVVPVLVLSFVVIVASHGRAVHWEAVHPAAMAPRAATPCAAAMRAATATRQRTRVAEQHTGEADGGDDRQCSCRHRSPNPGDGNAKRPIQIPRHYRRPGARLR
jgi:hypothetical protein